MTLREKLLIALTTSGADILSEIVNVNPLIFLIIFGIFVKKVTTATVCIAYILLL